MTKLSKDIVKSALENSGGIYAVIAQKCNVTRATMTAFMQKNPDIAKMCLEEKEKTLDLAENKLHKLIENGDFQAIKFYLVTQAKARGYVEKADQYITNKNAPEYKIEVIYPNAKDSVETNGKTG